MKRRITIEVDDALTTAEMINNGGCEDAFGLSSYVCRSFGLDDRERCIMAMKTFGIIVIEDERID